MSKNSKKEEQSLSDRLVPVPGEHQNIADEVVNRLISSSASGEISQEAKQKLTNFVVSAGHSPMTAMAMICKGENCPFAKFCPLLNAGLEVPVGSACPVEQEMIVVWVKKHLENLGIEDITRPEHSFDMDMLFELAAQQLVRLRCSWHLSSKPELISNEMVSVGQDGTPLFQDVINPVIDIMERAGRNVQKLRDALVATREAQVKAGQQSMDPSQRQADTANKARAALELRRKAREELTNNKEEIKSLEEYNKEISNDE